MSNPFRPLKYLPWSELFLSAAVTVAIATVLDFLFVLALSALLDSGALNFAIPPVLDALLSVLLPSAVSLGLGALSIFITERFFRQILLRAGTMWALIGCLLVLLFFRQFLPVPGFFIGGVNYFSMMGIVIGAFTYGRRHWRY